MYKWIVVFMLFLLTLLEGMSINLPLLLVGLILTTVLLKSEWVFVVGVILGFFLDALSFQLLGASSIFFVILLFIIFSYEKKFEIQSIPFVGAVTFASALIYGILFGIENVILEAIITTGIGFIGYFFAVKIF